MQLRLKSQSSFHRNLSNKMLENTTYPEFYSEINEQIAKNIAL